MGSARRDVRTGFPLFWSVALVSNVASGAQLVAVMWLLSDPAFSPWVLVNYQLVTVAGSLLGIAGGTALVSRHGVRRTLLLATIVEAAAAVVVALVTSGWDARASEPRAVALGVAYAMVPVGAGVGGPAWLALVAGWPGVRRTRDAQLLLDGAQFQLGRLAGPLLAGWALTSVPNPVARIASINAATFVVVVAVVAVAPETGSPATPSRTRPTRGTRSRALWRTPVAGAVALSAFSLDSTRTFLARYMREVGEAESTYAWSLTLIALGGAATALSLSRYRRPLGRFGTSGCLVAVAAMTCWAAAPWLGAWAWLAGGVLLGPAVAVTSASFTSSLMRTAEPGNDARGAATAMSVRTASGAAGGVVHSAVIPVIGTAAIFGAAALMVLAWLMVRRSADEDSRGSRAQARGALDGPVADGPRASTVDPVRSASERDSP